MNDLESLIGELQDIQYEPDDVQFVSLLNTELERYLHLENKLFSQIQNIQSQLDDAILSADSTQMKNCVNALGTLTKTYNDVCRLRQLAEIKEGKLLPMSVLDNYKSKFYPRLEQGLEEMRASVESLLPSHMRADFVNAWNMSYRRYTDACREAEEGLIDTRIEAKTAAMNLQSINPSNAKWQKSEPLREQLHDEQTQSLRKFKPEMKTEKHKKLRHKL